MSIEETKQEQENEAVINNEENTQDTSEETTEEVSNITEEEDNSFEIKYNEINDKFLRLYSEFDNYRKRTIKEKAELLKTAGEDMMKVLLPVLDDMDRAQKSMETADNITALKEGFDLINTKFRKILEQKGLKEMEALGNEFNADLHEAITQIQAPTEDDKGKILDVLEKGYLLNEKVIRHPKVVIGS